MPSLRRLILLFIPVLLLVSAIFAFRLIQLITINQKPEEQKKEVPIPILADDPILGDKRASATIVAFADLGCGNCKAQHELLKQIMAKYPKALKVVWKPLSVSTIPYPTRTAHRYAICANRQKKFEAFADLAFANQYALDPATLMTLAKEAKLDMDKLDTCLNDPTVEVYVTQNEDIAQFFGIQAVPAFFMDNKQINAPTTESGWTALLNLSN